MNTANPKTLQLTVPPKAAMYRAITERDPAFDGRFYYGVVTTGVYCRPSCAARPARRENLRLFADRGAAERAGFRAGFHLSEIGGIGVASCGACVEQLNRSGWFTGQSVEFRLVDPRGRLEPYTAEHRAPR